MSSILVVADDLQNPPGHTQDLCKALSELNLPKIEVTAEFTYHNALKKLSDADLVLLFLHNYRGQLEAERFVELLENKGIKWGAYAMGFKDKPILVADELYNSALLKWAVGEGFDVLKARVLQILKER